MKEIKKMFAAVLILSVLLSGCGISKTSSQSTQENKPVSPANPVSDTSSDTENLQEMKTVVIYIDEEEHQYQYSGKLTAEVLGEGLSEVTGLDFCFTSTNIDDGIIIDWEKVSRYFDLDFFPDGPSLCWFMMDSLWKTLTKNLGVENIYYTMNGGREFKLEVLWPPVKTLPSDTPYKGSKYYEDQYFN